MLNTAGEFQCFLSELQTVTTRHFQNKSTVTVEDPLRVETNQSECVFDLQMQTEDPNTKPREDVCPTEVSPRVLQPLCSLHPEFCL